ncbi:hypothetical protein [Streptomyces azureus]|uniref:Uncharacterized protein n=1 Tax=Streptomyces azureus TaxID=146537 RepID=A0A0K8PDP3_STRAJ|nr:hypothetical protein [Streptomyces azureus]GAP46012.1 uncharacterized protein SAZU_0744 [Streptomyces azureus]
MPDPKGKLVSTLALFVLVLAVIVALGVVAGLGYLAYRHPALKGPLTVALTAAGVLVALFVGVAQAGTQSEAGPGSTVTPTGR